MFSFEITTDEWQIVKSRRVKANVERSAPSGFYMVVVRGLPSVVSKQNIVDFFKGINITKGGIKVMKNGPIMAYVRVVSNADVKKAIAFQKKSFDSHPIQGNMNEFKIFMDPFGMYRLYLRISNSFIDFLCQILLRRQ